jgi:hypothetical protein
MQMKTLKVAIIVAGLVFGAPVQGQTDNGSIPKEYFGLHIHRADRGTAWPKVPFGSWRLWDAYVTWADMESAPGKWDFSRLDRYVAMAKLAGVDILLPLANTPTWAAARPAEKSGYKLGNASEPQSIDDWRRYVQAIAERYRGRIFNYEIWNEPNIRHHYSGSVSKLVELTCEAHKILKTIDARNRVISPAATAGAKNHIEYIDRFLGAGGSQCIDTVGHHFYVPNSPPEAMVPMIRAVKKVMARNGVGHLPLWNTETGYWIENGDGVPDHPMVARGGWKRLGLNEEAGEYLVRAFLIARAEGVDRFYWYSWDNPYGLGMISQTTGIPKPIADAWINLANKMIGASNLVCTEAPDTWSCSFVAKSGEKYQARWIK